MTRFALLLFLLLMLTACGSTGESMSAMFSDGRGSYVEEQGLTGKDSVHVMQGRIYRGMPVEHAVAALGPPTRRDTSTTADGRPRVEYMYEARANAFDPGNRRRAYVYAVDRAVTDWKDLDQIPRFDAYYEGGL